MRDPAAKLTRARFALMRDHPFFATILLQFQILPSETTATIETDGWHIRYNRAWLDEIQERHLQAVLAHNVMHIGFEHPLRLQGRDPDLANQAMDLAINPLLREAGFDLPPDARIDLSYGDMAWEQIYALLERRPQDDGDTDRGQGSPSGAGPPAAGPARQDVGKDAASAGANDPAAPSSCGQVQAMTGDDGQPASLAEIREAQAQARVLLVQAAQSARRAGKLGSGLERLVQCQVSPTTDWQSVLRRFVRERAQDGYSWARPNRRHAWRGVVLPSPYSQRLGEIVVAIDTSASFQDDELAIAAAETAAIFTEARPKAITVIYCDAKVTRTERFDTFDQFELRPAGGGGTRFQPVFDWVDDHLASPPACLIYFTDMQLFDKPRDPGYPVLWAANGDDHKDLGFGEVLPLG